MYKLLYVGEGAEIHPFKLLGVETLQPPQEESEEAWIEKVAAGGYGVILVSEEAVRSRPAVVEELTRRIAPDAVLSVVPDPARPRSEHLRFLRHATVRALGVDTWTAQSDVSASEKP